MAAGEHRALARKAIKIVGRQPVLNPAVTGVNTLNEVIAIARSEAKAGNAESGARLVADLADSALEAGAPWLAAPLCNVAREILGEHGGASSTRAVIDNTTAMLAIQAGAVGEASRWLADAARSATAAEDQGLLARVLLNTSNARRLAGEMDGALQIARDSLALFQRIGDPIGETKLLLTLASLHYERKSPSEALAVLDEAERLVHTLRVPDLTASWHGNRGLVLVAMGDHRAAGDAFRASLVAARRAGDVDKVVAALQDLGALAAEAGDNAAARRRLSQAANLAGQHGLGWRLVDVHSALARIEHRSGAVEAALDHAQVALDIAQEHGADVAPAQALVAATLISAGRPDEALDILREALPALAHGSWGDIDELGAVLYNVVVAAREIGQLDRAEAMVREHLSRLPGQVRYDLLLLLADATAAQREHADRALPLAREAIQQVPPPRRAWSALVAAAQFADDAPHVAEALYRSALTRARRTGQRDVELHCANDLALVLAQTGKAEESLALLQHVERSVGADDRVVRQRTAHNIAETLRCLRRSADALLYARDSLSLARQLGDPALIADAYLQYGLVRTDLGHLAYAANAFAKVIAADQIDDSVRAGAEGGLGSVALARGEFPDAITHYRRAARLVERPVQRAETLVGLCAALAWAQDPRGFDRALQRLIDHVQQERVEQHVLDDLVDIASAWAACSRPGKAGSTLAIALLLALSAGDRDGRDLIEDEAFLRTLALIGHVFGEDWPNGDTARRVRAGAKKALVPYLKTRATERLLRLIDEACALAAEDP